MNPQETILRSEILAEADRQAAKILTKAKNSLKAMQEQAEADRQQRRADRLAEARQEAQEQGRTLNNTTGKEIQRRWLQAREQVIADLFAQACQEAEHSQGDIRAASLRSLAAEALAALGPGDYQVSCAPEDASLVTAEWLADQVQALALTGQFTWQITTDQSLAGGLRFAALDGSRNFDNTYAARLRNLDSSLRTLLA